MPDWLKKIKPPKPGTSDTRVQTERDKPSPSVRTNYIKKIKEIKKEQEKKKDEK